MKKVLIPVMMFFCVTVSAQTTSGSFLLGGGIGYTSEKSQDKDDYDYSRSSITPSIGVFVMDKLAVGLNFGLTQTDRTSQTSTYNYTTSTFDFGPFIRYYLFTSNEKFAFYAQGNFNVSSGYEKRDTDPKTKNGEISIGITPGFTYFFTKHWAGELVTYGIRYSSYDPDKDADATNDKVNTVDIGINSLLPNTVGIRYYFGGR